MNYLWSVFGEDEKDNLLSFFAYERVTFTFFGFRLKKNSFKNYNITIQFTLSTSLQINLTHKEEKGQFNPTADFSLSDQTLFVLTHVAYYQVTRRYQLVQSNDKVVLITNIALMYYGNSFLSSDKFLVLLLQRSRKEFLNDLKWIKKSKKRVTFKFSCIIFTNPNNYFVVKAFGALERVQRNH